MMNAQSLRSKAGWRMALSLAACTVITGLLAGWLGSWYLNDVFSQQYLDDLMGTTRVLQQTLEGQDETPFLDTARILQNQAGSSLLIYDEQNRLLLGEDDGAAALFLTQVSTVPQFFGRAETDSGSMPAITGIRLDDPDGGSYRIFLISQTQVFDHLQNQWAISAGLIAAAVGILAWFLYNRSYDSLFQGVSEAADSMYDMAHGQGSEILFGDSPDELGKLAKAIRYLQKQVQDKEMSILREASHYRAVLERMKDGIILVNSHLRVVYANPGAGSLLGFDDLILRREPLQEVVKDYDLSEIMQRVVQGQAHAEFTLKTVLPTQFALKADIYHVEHEDEESPAAIIILQDVSQSERLARMRSDFVANVSHDMRTPLTAIQGFTETILDNQVDDAVTIRRFIEIIHQEADRLTRLIDDLLDLSRIESGRIRLDFRRTNMKKLIQETLEKLEPQLERVEIDLQTDLPDDLPYILADPDRIAQVVINYVDNSMKYTHKGGRIIVRALEAEDQIVVEVEDNGVGIPAPDVDRVFERFYRVDKSRTRMSGGTGLGLAIVKHIIEAHGGKVFVRSTPGEGSVFGFSLPKGE